MPLASLLSSKIGDTAGKRQAISNVVVKLTEDRKGLVVEFE